MLKKKLRRRPKKLTVGAAPTNNYRITGPGVADRHCDILLDAVDNYVRTFYPKILLVPRTELGVIVNDEKVLSPVPLRSDDVVLVGDVPFSCAIPDFIGRDPPHFTQIVFFHDTSPEPERAVPPENLEVTAEAVVPVTPKRPDKSWSESSRAVEPNNNENGTVFRLANIPVENAARRAQTHR